MEQNKDQSNATVSSEAVAEFTYKGPDGRFLDSGEWWVENSEIGNHMALPILRNGKTIALVFSEAHDDCKQEIEENCRLLCSAGNSARAADAPSEPSELAMRLRLIGEDSTVWLPYRVDVRRAADALDSQPTRPCQADSPSLEFRTLLEQCRMALADSVWRSTPPIAVLRKLYEQVDSALASSQPTESTKDAK